MASMSKKMFKKITHKMDSDIFLELPVVIKDESFTLAINSMGAYKFAECSNDAIDIIVDYDIDNDLDITKYTKENVITILSLFKDKGIAVGLETEMWISNNSGK